MTHDKTYCINQDCPFVYCENHIRQLPTTGGTYSFADLDKVCKKYITYLVHRNKSEVAE